MWKFNKIEPYLEELDPKNPAQKDHSIDAELIRKTLKIYKLPITNPILIKLTMIMYGKTFVQTGPHLEE